VVVVVTLVILVSLVALALYLGPPSTKPTHVVTPITTGQCVLKRGNITYVTQNVQIPTNGSGWGPLSAFSFQGISFRFWPQIYSTGDIYLQGTGQEPNGLTLAFQVFSNNSTAGYLGTGETAQNWSSPDGLFGVSWVTGNVTGIEAQLCVARPPFDLAYQNVLLNPLQGSTSTLSSVTLKGVNFTLQLKNPPPPFGQGLFLYAYAKEANGTGVPLSMGGPIPSACVLPVGVPTDVLGNVTCYEDGAPDYSLALAWDGSLNTTLMVRTG
jgi:hypothetical protein